MPEALGLVLLEAQAMSVPVVGTRNGGIPETLEEGQTGYLVDQESPGGPRRRAEDATREPGREPVVRGKGAGFRLRTLRH